MTQAGLHLPKSADELSNNNTDIKYEQPCRNNLLLQGQVALPQEINNARVLDHRD